MEFAAPSLKRTILDLAIVSAVAAGVASAAPAAHADEIFTGHISFWTARLSASATEVVAGTSVQLTAQANADVGPTPYYIIIFDQDTDQIVAKCGTGTNCTASVSHTFATETFVAEVGNGVDLHSVMALSDAVTVDWTSPTIWLNTNQHGLSCPPGYRCGDVVYPFVQVNGEDFTVNGQVWIGFMKADTGARTFTYSAVATVHAGFDLGSFGLSTDLEQCFGSPNYYVQAYDWATGLWSNQVPVCVTGRLT